ncbi:NAD-dependent epimerase/dehydratase family protein [Candidatus Woesearchaeota archaeon]|nr:NAD-dependent epimerase/dehydratase family protein [Candidatus Woesearchaeota archaeon]
MRTLITGGAGFIGSNVALELEKQGHEVIVIDDFSTGKKENLKEFKGKVINHDISLSLEIEKIDAVIHEAAITDPRFQDDTIMLKKNLDGFQNVVHLAKKYNAKLVYASSAGVYGNGPVPMKEDQEKDILTAYGKSKLTMDEQAKALAESMHIVGLRYFNVFGPHESGKGRPASMVYHLAKQMLAGKTPRIFKMGEQIRDHIYVKDCVKATLLALDAPSGVYNVGTGIGTSFNKLIEVLNEVLGTDFKPEYFDSPYDMSTYQVNTQADIEKAESKLKFKPDYSLKEAIKEYIGMI